MFFPSGPEIALPWLLITMLCWGLWPRFRNLCGASSPAFAVINVCSQVTMALIYGLTLGTPRATGSDWLNAESFTSRSSWGGSAFPTLQHGAVLLGGYVLGHADNIISVALTRIPEGIAFLIYGGINNVMSQILNYAQQGSRKPAVLLGGMLLVMGGILSSSLSQILRSSPRANTAQVMPVDIEDVAMEQAQSSLDCQTVAVAPSDTVDSPASPPPQLKSATRDGIMLAVICGIFCGFWSPLATFATNNTQLSQVPFVVLLIFPLGQLLALPSVVLLTLKLENQALKAKLQPLLSVKDVFLEIKSLPPRKKAWGIFCGCAINSGYCFYFSAVSTIPSAVAYGITACCCVFPLAWSCVSTDAFTGAPNRVRACLLLAFACYGSAIGVFVSIS